MAKKKQIVIVPKIPTDALRNLAKLERRAKGTTSPIRRAPPPPPIKNLSNWSGPHATHAKAIEAITLMCGTGYDALVWVHNRRWYVNDGVDPCTGRKWENVEPLTMKWVKIKSKRA